VLLIYFLTHEGLARAALWATVLGFAATLLGAIVSVWTLVLMMRADRSKPETEGTNDSQSSLSVTIRQINSGGCNIVHTGEGDINYPEITR
jgi:hypothetical protein